MNVTCPNCATVYRVDPAKVPEAGVRARCAVCSAVFAVNRERARRQAVSAASAGPSPVASAHASTAPVGRAACGQGTATCRLRPSLRRRRLRLGRPRHPRR